MLDGEKEYLSPNALSMMAEMLQKRHYDMVYSDEDRMEENGRRCDPFFKPDWSPDTFEEFFYTGNLTAYRGIFWGRLLEHSGEKSNIEGEENLRAWIYRQLHRCDWDRRTVGHIPKVLCHWKGRYPLICAEQTLEVPGQEKVSVI
ncbi:MAG: hypothetical protein MR416_02945, partial [Lachnospiraceae bacterium]|nr:hypothetical protein [Lachnospiraceae bacterium]